MLTLGGRPFKGIGLLLVATSTLAVIWSLLAGAPLPQPKSSKARHPSAGDRPLRPTTADYFFRLQPVALRNIGQDRWGGLTWAQITIKSATPARPADERRTAYAAWLTAAGPPAIPKGW